MIREQRRTSTKEQKPNMTDKELNNVIEDWYKRKGTRQSVWDQASALLFGGNEDRPSVDSDPEDEDDMNALFREVHRARKASIGSEEESRLRDSSTSLMSEMSPSESDFFLSGYQSD
jgi:hypothetical protein